MLVLSVALTCIMMAWVLLWGVRWSCILSVCLHVLPGELPGEAKEGPHTTARVWPAVSGGWGRGGPAASIKVI